MSWKILTGTAKEVEKQLNNLERELDWNLSVKGISTTNEQTTIVVQITGSKT